MKGWFTHNLGLKIISLILATGLWFFVAGQSTVEVGFFVPLGFSNIPEDMVMTSAPTGEIAVRVRGPKLVINNLTPSKITVGLDLSGAGEGLNKYRVEADNIAVPTGVAVTGVKPNSVRFRLAKIIRRIVIVKARLRGAPPKGYKVAEVSITPQSVEAAGLKKNILKIRHFVTKPIDVRGLMESKVFKVNLDFGRKELRSVTPDTIKVTVTIKKTVKKGTKKIHRKKKR